MAHVRIKQTGSLDRIAKGDGLSEQLKPFADRILSAARRDPNAEYTRTLRMRRFVSRGRLGRTSWQVGAAPRIGSRVEAKRGTLNRAVGEAGL